MPTGLETKALTALAAVAPFRPSSARKKTVSSTRMPPVPIRKTSHEVPMKIAQGSRDLLFSGLVCGVVE
jgi:hypothetical protein